VSEGREAPSSPLQALRGLRGAEVPFSVAMFSCFFLIITSFWVLKPLKKALFVEFYDRGGFELLGRNFGAAEAELLAKVLNLAVAFGAVLVFSGLSRGLRRERLILAFTAAFVAGYAGYFVLLGDPGPGTIWSFYLFGDLFSTVMVAAFWAFLNDSVDAERARWLYGPIGLGGVLGGVFGSMAVGALIETWSLRLWLGVCMGLGVGIAVAALAGGRIAQRAAFAPQASQAPAAVRGRGAALRGAALVARSPYLLAVVGLVGCYEVASTILDFQFTSAVAHYLDGSDIGSHMARVFAITNAVSATVQLFATSFVMARYGVGIALLVLPAAVLSGSAAFLALPGLWVGSALNTLDNGLSYSINQSAKEALYVPRSREEKYQAKAFIDMFVMRFAKVLAVGMSLAVGTWLDSFQGVRALSLAVLAIAVAWIAVARYAGRPFASFEASPPL
jgi:ATP:ADP antiporter, AAA family